MANRLVSRQGNVLDFDDEVPIGETAPSSYPGRTAQPNGNTLAGQPASLSQAANVNTGNAFGGASGFNIDPSLREDWERDPNDTSPADPTRNPLPQQTSWTPDQPLWDWWGNFKESGLGQDQRVKDWWSRYGASQGLGPRNEKWLPDQPEFRHDVYKQDYQEPWLRALQTGWHQGFLNDPDPYQAGLTYYQDPGTQDPYAFTGEQWRTGVPEGYLTDPATSSDAGFVEWAKTAGPDGGPLVTPWTQGSDTHAQWRDDAAYRQRWSDETWAKYNATVAPAGDWKNPGEVPTGVDPTDPKWASWLTPEGKVPNQGNIIRFLQTHFPSGFNTNAMTGGNTPGSGIMAHLQWVFGAGITFDGKDKITLPNGAVIDIIQGAERGGTGWVWLPIGAGGDDGGARDGSITSQPWGQQLGGGDGTGGGGDVSLPPYAYTPGAIPNTPLSVYNPYRFGNQNLPTYNPYDFSQAPFPTYNPYDISQYTQPDQSAYNQQQLDLVQYLLQNPTLNAQALAQAREQQKDTILSLGQQLGQDAAERAASTGTFGGGGYEQTLQNIRLGQMGDITKAYRDINLQAADINRQAQERALTQSEDILGGQLDRSVLGYETGLGGQTAQARENALGIASLGEARRFGRETEQLNAAEQRAMYDSFLNQADWRRAGQAMQADENRFGFQSQVASEQDQIQRFLAQEAMNERAATGGLANYMGYYQNLLGAQNLGLDRYLAQNRMGLGWGDLDLRRTVAENQGNQWLLDYLQSA